MKNNKLYTVALLATFVLLLNSPATAEEAVKKQVEATPSEPSEKAEPQSEYIPEAATETAEKIEVGELRTPSAEDVGFAEENKPTFSANLWKGSTRTNVENLLKNLPTAYDDLNTRELAVRLLTTAADVPIGTKDAEDLLGVRVYKLINNGYMGRAAKLIERVPQTMLDEKITRSFAEIYFAARKLDKACELVDGAVQKYQDAYWQTRKIFCLARQGKTEEMGLSIALLREQDPNLADFKTKLFEKIADIAAGKESSGSKLQLPESLTTFDALLVESAKGFIPKETVMNSTKNMSLGEIREIAESGAVDVETRAKLHEKLVSEGADSAEHLAEMYAKIAENPDKSKDEELRSRATLYAKASKEEVGPQKTEAILKFAAACEKASLFVPCALVLNGDLKEITPLEDEKQNLKLAKLMIANYQFEDAATMLDNQLGGNNIISIALGAIEDNHPGQILPEEIVMPESKKAVASKLLAFLKGIGFKGGAPKEEGTPDISNLVENRQSISQEILSLLDSAAENKRIGEVVSISLIAIGKTSVTEVSPDDLARVVRALKTAGLENEADQVTETIIRKFTLSLVD